MKIILFSVLALAGCTDATKANWTTLGSPGDVTCYSGNMVIYQGRSTGKIQTVQNSDGWEFKDAATGKFVRVSGPCVIVN
jgi:hypothetical protein